MRNIMEGSDDVVEVVRRNELSESERSDTNANSARSLFSAQREESSSLVVANSASVCTPLCSRFVTLA